MTDQERNEAPCLAPTGPGKYLRRDGNAVVLQPRGVSNRSNFKNPDYPWIDECGTTYASNGAYDIHLQTRYDIIAPFSLEPTDEQVVARFNELVAAERVEYFNALCWHQVHESRTYRLRPEPKSIFLKVTLPPGCEEKLREFVGDCGGEVG